MTDTGAISGFLAPVRARYSERDKFDINKDGKIDGMDVGIWAKEQKFLDQFISESEGLVLNLFKIDMVSEGLRLAYQNFFSGETCGSEFWMNTGNAGKNGGDINRMVLQKIRSDMDFLIRNAQSATDEINRYVSDIRNSLDFYTSSVRPDDQLLSPALRDVIDEFVDQALEHERAQVSFYKSVALSVLKSGMDGPAGIGASVYDSHLYQMILVREADLNDLMNNLNNGEVFWVEKDGSADRAGLRTGDVIVSVRDGPVAGRRMSADGVFELLMGQCGSTVEIKVRRHGKTRSLSIQRDVPDALQRMFASLSSLLGGVSSRGAAR